MALALLQALGPYRDRGGHGHHTRMLLVELVRRGVDVRLLRIPWTESIPDGEVPPELRDRDGLSTADVALHLCLPKQVTTAVRPDAKHVNYTMFEASPIPRDWVERAKRIALTLLPTETIRQIWIDSGVPEARVATSPLGVDTDTFRPGVEPLDLRDAGGRAVATYAHRFLNVSATLGRKNLSGLYRAFQLAVRRSDDAALIMVVTGGIPDGVSMVARECKAIDDALGIPPAERAPVVVIAKHLPAEAMPRLFASATCYVSLSRGEGWDLPMLEAAATGLDLIAPRHTAYRDYLDDTVATLIPAIEAPAREWGSSGPYFAGTTWWEPVQDAAIAAIRATVSGAPRTSRREDVRARVAVPRSWSAAAGVLHDHLTRLAGS